MHPYPGPDNKAPSCLLFLPHTPLLHTHMHAQTCMQEWCLWQQSHGKGRSCISSTTAGVTFPAIQTAAHPPACLGLSPQMCVLVSNTTCTTSTVDRSLPASDVYTVHMLCSCSKTLCFPICPPFHLSILHLLTYHILHSLAHCWLGSLQAAASPGNLAIPSPAYVAPCRVSLLTLLAQNRLPGVTFSGNCQNSANNSWWQ